MRTLSRRMAPDITLPDSRFNMGIKKRAPSAGVVYTLPMRFFLLIFALFLAPGSALATVPEGEFIAVPATGTAEILDENYAVARENAKLNAFTTAARLAVGGLINPDLNRERDEEIDKEIASKGMDFVFSYKFLEETIDRENGTLTVRLQVTLFLDSIRSAVENVGIGVKKRVLPNVLVIMDEQSEELFANTNFLLLNSMSERIMAQAFSSRGYLTVQRKEIREGGADELVVSAFEGSLSALVELHDKLGTDLFAFGTTKVEVEPSGEGNSVKATSRVRLYSTKGKMLAAFGQEATGEFEDALKGSLDTINAAVDALAKELTLQTPRIWKEHSMEVHSDDDAQ